MRIDDLFTPMLRPRVMGVVNVTPDSFSDGGLYATTEAAVQHGLTLLGDGADILDVGGESTRPGATRPLVSDELDRVLPVIEALRAQGALVSVDTMRAEVAQAAIQAGARIVNDVSGGLADPEILSVVAQSDTVYVAMHWRAHADTMTAHAKYDTPGGVVAAVREELAERAQACAEAGIDPDRVILDPGLGFAKQPAHNWELLRHLADLESLGHRMLVGASRKSFLGALLADSEGRPRPVEEREAGNVALAALLARRNPWGLRVHDVRSTRDALAVWQRLETEMEGGRK